MKKKKSRWAEASTWVGIASVALGAVDVWNHGVTAQNATAVTTGIASIWARDPVKTVPAIKPAAE